MSRKQHRKPRRPAAAGREPTASRTTVGSFADLCALVVSVLITARYFLPAESAALGETLWIVQFWFIAGVLWLWAKARSGCGLRRLDGLDWGLGLLIVGHVVSALVVLATEGDRRAALNMLWEWLGIGVSALMIRDALSEHRGRGRVLSAIVISSLTLSGYGLWQHYVWYPQMSDLLTEAEELSRSAPSSAGDLASRNKRLNELNRDLGLLSFDDDSGATKLLRARIAASTEPIGRFALANTLAGLLLVGLLLGIGGVLADRGRLATRWRLAAAIGLLAVLGYCFWLTKSRTAWVGLITGLLVWWVAAGRGWRLGAGMTRLGVLFALLLVGLPVVASLSGGLDREVITESPKSLRYRLEYWSATGCVIREHPWLGVGPGNFRQAYLKHKLPGSSEEVLDPHNLFLDVWANGGLIAVAGLLVTLFVLLRALQQIKRQYSDAAVEIQEDTRGGEFLWRCLVGGLALGTAALTGLFSGAGGSNHGWWLLAGWCGVSFVWPPIGWRSGVGPLLAAATVALIVHLTGAGGIAMPALLQTLVIVTICLVDEAQRVTNPAPQESRDPDRLPWPAMAAAAVCFCLAVACAFSATLPVSAATTHVQIGHVLMAQESSPSPAMRSFQEAIEADPLASGPWQELALAMLTDWTRGMGTDDETFASAVAAQREAIRRNPDSANSWKLLGRIWWRRFEQTQDRAAAHEAYEAFGQAVKRYPNQASLQAEYAKTAVAADHLPEAPSGRRPRAPVGCVESRAWPYRQDPP